MENHQNSSINPEKIDGQKRFNVGIMEVKLFGFNENLNPLYFLWLCILFFYSHISHLDPLLSQESQNNNHHLMDGPCNRMGTPFS